MKTLVMKMPKWLRGFLFKFIQWTWGILQNIVGAVAALFFRGDRYRYHGALVTVYRKRRNTGSSSGFSLGTFIFIPETWSEYDKTHIVVHEYGHSVQSLMLGPFYLLVVGIPSVIWSNVYSLNRAKYREKGVKYTDRFPENEADRLGELITGEKPC